jgi:glutathione peroxidase
MKIKIITLSLFVTTLTGYYLKFYTQTLNVNFRFNKPVNFKIQKNMHSFYDLTAIDIQGKDFSFAQLKGKKVMIVNTASECGLTPQYKELEALYKKYGANGKFIIIGFPANDFGSQEPGTNEQIIGFCQKNYGVSFPMMSKVTVKGDNKHPVYKWLTQKSLNGKEDVEISWNFQKFLIDENGQYIKTISPRTLPNDPEIIKWIEGK